MMKVPVKMPKNKEEITSFKIKAMMMATNGGKIDIQSGIKCLFLCQKYNIFLIFLHFKSILALSLPDKSNLNLLTN